MKLTFPGTRGGIKLRSPEHFMHSCAIVQYKHAAILIDCGEDWLGHLPRLRAARAVVITHGHPDHIGGLRSGWDRPVWATVEAWQAMSTYPLDMRNILIPHEAIGIAGLQVTAIPVQHSLRAPAVGLRIQAGEVTVFYVPDVLLIEGPGTVLGDVDLFVGDGASLNRGVFQRSNGHVVGHASIREQLGWCAEAGLRRAIFTHCGSPTVRNPERASRILKDLGQEAGIGASFAHDGLELVVR